MNPRTKALVTVVVPEITVRSTAGAGDAAVNAQETLPAGIAGSGDVVCIGNAAVESSVAGHGSVKKKQGKPWPATAQAPRHPFGGTDCPSVAPPRQRPMTIAA